LLNEITICQLHWTAIEFTLPVRREKKRGKDERTRGRNAVGDMGYIEKNSRVAPRQP
jgi:hypothetical protein